MPSRVTIFNHNGFPIAELNTATTRSWMLDAQGQVQFSLATFTDPNCTRTILQYGNFVLIEHIPTRTETGSVNGKLPDWLGIILPPQEWSYGILIVTAFSIEALLRYRPMPFVTLQGSAGYLFSSMLVYANELNGFPIQPGSIYTDTNVLTVDLRLSLYEEAQSLANLTAQDFDLTWKVGANKQLVIYGNWYSQKGVTVQSAFSEGRGGNMKLPKLTEQGEIFTLVIGYSNASSPDMRLQATAAATLAQGEYGVLADSQVFNVNDQSGLTLATASYKDLYKRPQTTLELTVLDVGKAFTFLNPGNIWKVILQSVGFYAGDTGFQGFVRIKGLEYDDMTNEVTLVTQVLTASLTDQNYA